MRPGCRAGSRADREGHRDERDRQRRLEPLGQQLRDRHCVKIEVPRSPCASLPTQIRNWFQSGRSRPSELRRRAMSSVVASRRRSARPGRRRQMISRKTITATTAITGSVAAMRRAIDPSAVRSGRFTCERPEGRNAQYASRFFSDLRAANAGEYWPSRHTAPPRTREPGSCRAVPSASRHGLAIHAVRNSSIGCRTASTAAHCRRRR